MMTTKQSTSKTLHIILWIVQILVAATFIWTGFMKLLQPYNLPWQWIKENPGLVKVTAILDLLAGIGLVLPTWLHIKPELTIYAAYGTILLMIAASIFHISRGEASQIGFNIFMAIAAVFIAWGRRTKAPITPRQ